MIPRYQRILYWTLVAGILLMLALLVRGCERNHQRIAAMRDQSPIPAPTDIPNETATLAMPNDADASLSLDQRSLALPAEPSLRARVLLERLLTELAQPDSAHPVPGVSAVTDVFFVPLPIVNPQPDTSPVTQAQPPSSYGLSHQSGAMLAVVNLTKEFADQHPSGIEAEDLTLRALAETLHANFPELEQVRFTVDGQTRDTLAGHADLSRPYALIDPQHVLHTVGSE